MNLTPREKEIIYLASSGMTNAQIAHMAGISKRTVGAHLENIYKKLGAKNKIQALCILVKNGFLNQTSI